jgi:3-hydroxybutyryl-CoA dehydratase
MTETRNQVFTNEEIEGPLAIGRTYTFSKTVGESDVYLFAGITGDLSPNHVNDEYMARTRYGKRIAHGVLSIGFMSTCSTMVIDAIGQRPAVSYGYDRIRFVKPIFIGDTITVEYRIAERDDARGMTRADVSVKNQHGEVCTVATHLLKLL